MLKTVFCKSYWVLTCVFEYNPCASSSCIFITCSSYKVILVSFQFVRHNSLFFQFSGFLKVYCILFDKSSEKRSKNMTIWPGILWNMYHSRSTVVTPSPSLCCLMLNSTTSPTSFSSMGSLDCSFRWNIFPLHISIEFRKLDIPSRISSSWFVESSLPCGVSGRVV